MANKTVYPYGTGGSLPENIGIVNDLVTGGSNKALSAQQGVVINDSVINPITQIDLDTVPQFDGVLVVSGAWSNGNTGHLSAVVPVTPGQKYRITGNATRGSIYAFFSDVSLWVKNGTPNYSSFQSGRVSIAAGVTVEITIPSDTHYLYLNRLNAGTSYDPQSVYLIESKQEADYREEQDIRYDISGSSTELCNYETDVFRFTGTSEQGQIEKVGNNGYWILTTSSVSGKYFLYTLPSGLVDGRTYRVSFDYQSYLSANWALSAASADGTIQNVPARAIQIPASGSGRIIWNYTYLEGDVCLRLALVSQSSRSSVIIKNLSITANNLTTTALSTRMSVAEPYPVIYGATWKSYWGKKIDTVERTYTFGKYMDAITSHQSGACFGDYLVTFTDKMATIRLYNLRTRTLLATVTQTALDSFHHCNQSFFGTEKYDPEDVFPLVYLTVNNNGTESGGYMEVYRIVPTMGTTDYNAFTITLVQTVTLPIMSEDNALGNANFVLDQRSGYLYTCSRNNDSSASNYGKLRITRWNMPTLSQGDVVLTDNDILDSWETGTSALNNQGAAIKNHLLFIFRGYQNAGYIRLLVVDLFSKVNIANIDLLSDGFTAEPEGVFFWGNTLYTSTNRSGVYRFFFR